MKFPPPTSRSGSYSPFRYLRLIFHSVVCNRLLQVISESSRFTLTRREILALLCNLFSFARCAVAGNGLFLISTSDVGPNYCTQSVSNELFITIKQRLSTLVSLIQCFPFHGGYRVLARFNTYFHVHIRSQVIRLILSVICSFFHPPTAIVTMKPSNVFFFVCSDRIVEK